MPWSDIPMVDKIAFTGETETGRQIMAKAAETIKKVSLELGGKSPNIVFPDANIDEAINGSLFAIYTNAGQRCTARTRLFLHKDIYDEFLDSFVARAKHIRVGDPLEHETQMGPVISPQQRDRILHYCGLAQDEGAELLAGGRKIVIGDLAAGNFRRTDRFWQSRLRHDPGPGRSVRSGARGDSLFGRG